MGRERKCKTQFQEFVNCVHHEKAVEMDKLRRDVTRHTEWWWLNIYDEHGEIGKQAEWQPEPNPIKMWFKDLMYNFIVKDD